MVGFVRNGRRINPVSNSHFPPFCLEIFPGCDKNEFMCDVTRCIPDSWRCNGTAECSDGTDEVNCVPSSRPVGKWPLLVLRCVILFISLTEGRYSWGRGKLLTFNPPLVKSAQWGHTNLLDCAHCTIQTRKIPDRFAIFSLSRLIVPSTGPRGTILIVQPLYASAVYKRIQLTGTHRSSAFAPIQPMLKPNCPHGNWETSVLLDPMRPMVEQTKLQLYYQYKYYTNHLRKF